MKTIYKMGDLNTSFYYIDHENAKRAYDEHINEMWENIGSVDAKYEFYKNEDSFDADPDEMLYREEEFMAKKRKVFDYDTRLTSVEIEDDDFHEKYFEQDLGLYGVKKYYFEDYKGAL